VEIGMKRKRRMVKEIDIGGDEEWRREGGGDEEW
jgi:hypothetical protein